MQLHLGDTIMTDVITGHEATKETCYYGHNLKPPVRVGELCCQLVIIPAKSGLRPYGLAPQREFRKGSSKVRHAIAAGGGTHESPLLLLLMGLVESDRVEGEKSWRFEIKLHNHRCPNNGRKRHDFTTGRDRKVLARPRDDF